jgi:membrane protein DedA with SNARE-associated domain
VFNHLVDLVSEASGWAYAVVFALAVLDVLVPLVPAETAVITAGVVAATGGLDLLPVIVAAAAGAFAGDNIAYALGHRYGVRAAARFARGERARGRLEWARRQLAVRGGELILVGRFIPGGRTAVTVSAGMLGYPWRRFALFDLAAAIGWASYAAVIGYVGGAAFEQSAWKGLLLALVFAFLVGAGVEAVRRFRPSKK